MTVISRKSVVVMTFILLLFNHQKDGGGNSSDSPLIVAYKFRLSLHLSVLSCLVVAAAQGILPLLASDCLEIISRVSSYYYQLCKRTGIAENELITKLKKVLIRLM